MKKFEPHFIYDGLGVFDVGHSGAPRTLSLVPVIDLVNHGFGVVNRNTMAVDVPSNESGFVLNANEPLRKGQELLHSYNEHMATSSYLFKYGFMNGDLAVEAGDFIVLRTATATYAVGANGAVSPRFLAALRADTHAARAIVLAAVQARMRALPTTLEEDEAALKQGTTEDWMQTCLNLRIRSKRVLHALARWTSDQAHTGATPAATGTAHEKFKGSEAYALADIVLT